MNIVPEAPWEHPYEKFQKALGEAEDIAKHGTHNQRDHSRGRGGKKRIGPPKMKGLGDTVNGTSPSSRGPSKSALVAAAEARRRQEKRDQAQSTAGRRKKRIGAPKMKRRVEYDFGKSVDREVEEEIAKHGTHNQKDHARGVGFQRARIGPGSQVALRVTRFPNDTSSARTLASPDHRGRVKPRKVEPKRYPDTASRKRAKKDWMRSENLRNTQGWK